MRKYHSRTAYIKGGQIYKLVNESFVQIATGHTNVVDYYDNRYSDFDLILDDTGELFKRNSDDTTTSILTGVHKYLESI